MFSEITLTNKLVSVPSIAGRYRAWGRRGPCLAWAEPKQTLGTNLFEENTFLLTLAIREDLCMVVSGIADARWLLSPSIKSFVCELRQEMIIYPAT